MTTCVGQQAAAEEAAAAQQWHKLNHSLASQVGCLPHAVDLHDHLLCFQTKHITDCSEDVKKHDS
jgi:hypothetical protein